jgi:hypothetical protein
MRSKGAKRARAGALRPARFPTASLIAFTRRAIAAIGRNGLALAGGPVLDLDLALGDAARADDDLPGQADQVGGGELRPLPLVGVVVEHVDSRRAWSSRVELLAGRVAPRRRRPSC